MRIVHYLNQFFAGVGGEDRADTPPGARPGAVGPRLALRLGRGEPLGPAAVEGYLPRGRRMNAWAPVSASERALRLLLGRLRQEPLTTEVELPRYDRVAPPPPIADPTRMRLALVTE